MTRFISDQNKVLGIFESGTYGVPLGSGTNGSTFWIGEIQSHDIKDDEKLMITSYLGTATRSWNQAILGARDVTGKIIYYPQNMRMLFWSIGSTQSLSGTNSTHSVSEIDSNVRQSPYTSGPLNPPLSFTIEDSQVGVGTGRNMVRTVNGATIEKTIVNFKQGDKVRQEIDYIGQTLVYTSGVTTIGSSSTNIPYLWNNVTLTMNGSSIDTAKDIVFEVNNNVVGEHYLNGSRDISVPYKGNRDYVLDVTSDLESTLVDTFYRQFYKGGSSFNVTLDLNADSSAGSQHTILYMSGVVITQMDMPSVVDKTTNSKWTMRPKNITGSEWSNLNSLPSGLFGPY